MNSGFFLLSIFCCTAVIAIRPLLPEDHYNRIRTIDDRDDQLNYRLPNNTKPETYDITLKTYLEQDKFNFDGQVSIFIRVLEETSEIKIHHRQLTIGDVSIYKPNSAKNLFNGIDYSNDIEILTIKSKEKLNKDAAYIVVINYKGELRNDLGGFYRSSYKDANGILRWLAATQFESTEARHAFPCYDEPAFKANFTINIEHGDGYNSISNMPGARKVLTPGRVKTEFETTPFVSTYLIAFIVSDFTYTEKAASDTNPYPQRVFTTKQQIGQTEYPLNEGVNILNAIANYLQVPFSLPKMDQAAIPQFRAGAMENWGLVTYREELLLFDPSIHLPSRQYTISSIIAHEFGHQWFGNLVSPKWWTYIWLNEGFATLFDYIGTDLTHPDWNVFHDFVLTKLQPAFRKDAKNNTRAMTTYAESPNEIGKLFDDIAYSKSGSVLRMFLHALSEQTFKKGLKYYLEANSYNVAEENDLFESLDKAAKEDKKLDSNLNVKDLFGSWSNQEGFPVLKVTRNSNGSVTLHQQKYNEVYKPDEIDPTTWWIPYNFATAKNPVFNETMPLGWLPKETREKLIEPNNDLKWSKDDWLLFNRQQTGFYRVLYDEHNYNLVNEELNTGDPEKIHILTRTQYLDDLAEFVNSGRLPPTILFNALSYLEREKSYAPWVTASKTISNLKQILSASTKLDDFDAFVAKLVTPFYTNKTLDAIEGEGLFDKFSRSNAVDLACAFGVEQCLNETYTKFKDFIKSGNKPAPHNRGVIFGNGIRRAETSEILKFWTFFINTKSSDERKEAIISFGNIQNITDIELILNSTIVENTELSQSDRLSIIKSITERSQNGLTLTIQFLHRDLDNVNQTIGSITYIFDWVANKIVTAEVETEFVKLLEHAKSKNLISDSAVESLKKIVIDKVGWQKEHLKQYEDSIPKSLAAQMTALPALLALLFYIVRWNSQ